MVTAQVYSLSFHIFSLRVNLSSFSIIVTLQLTIFMSTSSLQDAIFIFYHHHFHWQLSLYNWLSSWLHPLHNILSWATFLVLWSSGNFCNISKTCTLKLQLLHKTKRPTKWSGHVKMNDHPRELLHMKDLLTERVTI